MIKIVKTRSMILLVLFLSVALILSSCLKDDKDPCDATKWEQSVNYSVKPKLKPAQAQLPYNYLLKNAVELKFEAVLAKYHCGGTWSANYSLISYHDPRAIDDEFWNEGFYVGDKVYGFDFDNDEDFLQCGYTLTATFGYIDEVKYYLSLKAVKVKPPFIPDWTYSYFYLEVDPSWEWILLED